MNKFNHLAFTACLATALMACQPKPSGQENMANSAQTKAAAPIATTAAPTATAPAGKIVIYQAFTRLFGNSNSNNQPWGTIAQNGVGKFNDINDAALLSLKAMGVSHLWLTGVPHHALVADYSAYGISPDDPDVVKGRAGSPYAVKDYYSVNPDLAVDPAKRIDEFKALINRAHQHGIRVMIDIVPNHVARHYQSLGKPAGVRDFGADDNTALEYHKNNNFYYVPGQAFVVPDTDVKPLGGEAHPLSDGKFAEMPAKWTGNGARAAKPDQNDWYETVKINYGVKPDGSYDFERLPADYATKSYAEHAAFWQGKELPDSWLKFRQITEFWLDFGVDGFRFDMAEMVPVEFWSYLNSHIKLKNPQAVLLAEVYQPQLYRDYVGLGKMDYLYDKVGVYDSLKLMMQGKGTASEVLSKQAEVADIDQHMLKFLENHDEQRIASPEFAGSAEKGKPAMVVSTLIGKAPTLLYFGQEVGEAASLDPGFGKPSRTSIFDYVGVPAHQGWLNGGKYDGGGLTAAQRQLRDFYQKLLSFSSTSTALQGEFYNLHQVNLVESTQPQAKATENAQKQSHYSEQQLSFARWNAEEKLIVVANFAETAANFELKLPTELLQQWGWPAGDYQFTDVLTGQHWPVTVQGETNAQQALFTIQLAPQGSLVLQHKTAE